MDSVQLKVLPAGAGQEKNRSGLPYSKRNAAASPLHEEVRGGSNLQRGEGVERYRENLEFGTFGLSADRMGMEESQRDSSVGSL